MPEISLPEQYWVVRRDGIAMGDERLPPSSSDALPDVPGWLVPIDQGLSLLSHGQDRDHAFGIVLSADDSLDALFSRSEIGTQLPKLSLIAIHFPSHTDGRGYSIAQVLRLQHGWRGELRAIGDVLPDSIGYLARCGFDSFVLKSGHDVDVAIAAFTTFSAHYQRSHPTIGVNHE